MPAPTASKLGSVPPEVQPRRRVSGELTDAPQGGGRQALREEVPTVGLLTSRKAVRPTAIRRSAKSVEGPQRGSKEEEEGMGGYWREEKGNWGGGERDERTTSLSPSVSLCGQVGCEGLPVWATVT